jgi:hypothetical protein
LPREVYQFTATGDSDVRDAFKSIAAESRRASQAVSASYTSIEKKSSTAAASIYRVSGRAEEQRATAAEGASRRIIRVRNDEERAAERAANRRVHAEEQANRRIQSGHERMVGRVAMRALSFVGRAALNGAEQLVGGALRESLSVASIANRVSINGRGAGQTAIDPRILQKEFHNVAKATPGIKAADVGAAVQEFVSLTGDLDTARKSMQSFATAASATGADITDVSRAASQLSDKFDVKGPEEMQKALAILTFQGKQGAFEIKDMAGQFNRLGASAAAFDIGKGSSAVATLGGLAQIAFQGTGSARGASTAVENVFSALTQKSGVLKGQGVHVYGKTGERRDIREVLAETISMVGGSDIEKKNAGLNRIFGKQGIRAVNPLIAAYTDATKGMSGADAQKAGYEAVKAALDKAISTTGDWSEVQKDAAQAQQDSSAKMTAAWERVVATTSDSLLPALVPLIDKLPEFVPAAELVIKALGLLADGVVFLTDLLPGSDEDKQKRARSHKVLEASKELDAMEKSRASSKIVGTPTLEEMNKRQELEDVVRNKGFKFEDASKVVGSLPEAPPMQPIQPSGPGYDKAAGFSSIDTNVQVLAKQGAVANAADATAEKLTGVGLAADVLAQKLGQINPGPSVARNL